MPQRYFLEIAYHGKNYHGWQIQPQDITVQSEIDRALSLILRQKINSVGSGRTDAGVHAKQQYAHFDVHEKISDLQQTVYLLNRCLGKDICITNILKPKSNVAHARFQAIGRSYEYHIARIKNPFKTELAYHYPHPLGIEKMNLACKIMQTYTDFESFSKRNTDVNHFRCKIYESYWESPNEHNLIFHIKADRFLRGMVRTVVGTLIDVGRGATSLEQFKRIIEIQDRTYAGRSVPAHGLYLNAVKYPKDFFEE